jgi:hypothetical protein
MRSSLWTVAVVAILLGVGVVALGSAADDAGTMHVANETHTLDNTTAVQLDNASEWAWMIRNETVNSTTTTATYDRGEDYLIDYPDGEITANTTITDGEQVHVEYYYQTADQTTATIVGIFELLGPAIGLLLALAAIGALMSLLGWS